MMLPLSSSRATIRSSFQQTLLKLTAPSAPAPSLHTPNSLLSNTLSNTRAFSSSALRAYEGPQPPRQIPPRPNRNNNSSRPIPRNDNTFSRSSQNEEIGTQERPKIEFPSDLKDKLKKAGYSETQIQNIQEQARYAFSRQRNSRRRRRKWFLVLLLAGVIWIFFREEKGRDMGAREKELERRERELERREAKLAGVNAYTGQRQGNEGEEKWD